MYENLTLFTIASRLVNNGNVVGIGVSTNVGLVCKLCSSICIGINIGIANPFNLVLIHLVPIPYQHTPSMYLAKNNNISD
jgi:hypothetical protein